MDQTFARSTGGSGHFFARGCPRQAPCGWRGFYGLGRLLFHHITHCPGAQRAFGVKGFFVHRNHQDGKFGITAFEGFDEVNARSAGAAKYR